MPFGQDVLDGTVDLIVSEDCRRLFLRLGVGVSHHPHLSKDDVSNRKSDVFHWFSHCLIPTPFRVLFGFDGGKTRGGETQLRES